VNTASVTTNEISSPVIDDATTTITQNPLVTINKTASPVTYTKVGDVITYTIVVENTGNVTASDISISDPMVTLSCGGSGPYILSPGSSLTCTGTYSVTQSDLTNSSITNTVTASGKFGTENFSVTGVNTIQATYTSIDAVDDNAIGNPVSGGIGGTAVVNVLENDLLNGVQPTVSDVYISVVTPASDPKVSLNTATGEVTVAPMTP
jgi:uncharacterized repeat protein (TIGR01451 family)